MNRTAFSNQFMQALLYMLLLPIGMAHAYDAPPAIGSVDRIDTESGYIVIDDRMMMIANNLVIHAGEERISALDKAIHVGDTIGYRAEFARGDESARWLLLEVWIFDHGKALHKRNGPPMQLPIH